MSDDKRKPPHMFKPGQSGNPAGRPKDAISKPNMLKRSRELGIHPEDFLLYFAAGDHKKLKLQEKDITPNMRLKATIEALKKMVPDLKSVDHNLPPPEEGDDGPVRTVVILPSNTREGPEHLEYQPLDMDEVSAGVKEAIDASLDND